jgi:hypothetical protein
MKNFIEILILIIPPVAYALWNGRNGISHPAVKQVLWVTIIMMSCAIGISTYELATQWPIKMASLRWVHIKCLAVSITGYGLFFPPLMNFVLMKVSLKNIHRVEWDDIRYCLDHLSPTAWPDRLLLKLRVHWAVRLGVYFGLFLVALIWFV